MSWSLNNGYDFVMWQSRVGGSGESFEAKVWVYKNKPNCWIPILRVSSHTSRPIYHFSPFSLSSPVLPFPLLSCTWFSFRIFWIKRFTQYKKYDTQSNKEELYSVLFIRLPSLSRTNWFLGSELLLEGKITLHSPELLQPLYNHPGKGTNPTFP